MSIPQLHIKFSQPNGSTRVVVFETLVSWDDLTTRVKTFFDISADSVALAYIDSDGDEVTLSSQCELAELLSSRLHNIDSTTASLKFTVRDLRSLREVREPEDTNNRDQQPTSVADRAHRAQGERALPLGDGEDRTPFGRVHAMPFMPSRGFRPSRGCSGRGMHGGFTGGHFGGHHGPPGFQPPVRGVFAHIHGRPDNRCPPPLPMSQEMFRAHSASEDDAPAPEDFAEDFALFDGPFQGFRAPPHGEAHIHHHHHPYIRSGPLQRGNAFAHGRGGFGFGHHGPFGHGSHDTLSVFDEHHIFNFGGRGGHSRCPPGFGRANPRMGTCGLRMSSRGGFGDPCVTVV